MATRLLSPRHRSSERDVTLMRNKNMSDPKKILEEVIPSSFISRVFANDALKRGLAGAVAGTLVACVMELAWPSEQ